jgi:hypothetical protein
VTGRCLKVRVRLEAEFTGEVDRSPHEVTSQVQRCLERWPDFLEHVKELVEKTRQVALAHDLGPEGVLYPEAVRIDEVAADGHPCDRYRRATATHTIPLKPSYGWRRSGHS